jgi:isopropylmalate/homocitrate/citramalate synthase
LSRRIYYWNPKRKQIHQEALLNLRSARKAIDPELLENARQAIASGLEQVRDEGAANSPDYAAGAVAVDRQKNLTVIMQYLELKRDDQQLLGKVKGLMLDM